MYEEGEQIGTPKEKIVGFAIAVNPDDGMYVPINHIEEPELNLSEKDVFSEIKRLCSCCTIIVHHAKFDLQFLRNYGIDISDPSMFEDTMILARLYDASRKEINLKILGAEILQRPQIDFDKATGGNKRFDYTPPSVAFWYAAPDAMNTFRPV